MSSLPNSTMKTISIRENLSKNSEYYYKTLAEKEIKCYNVLEQDTNLFKKRTEIDELIKLNEEKKKELNDINVLRQSNENIKVEDKLFRHMFQFEEFSTGNALINSAVLKSGTKVLLNKKSNQKSKVIKYYNEKSLSQMEEMNSTFIENNDIAMMYLTLDL